MNNLRVFSTAADCAGEDPGSLQDRIQELPEQHGEEAGPARHGKPLLRTQDGSGRFHRAVVSLFFTFPFEVTRLNFLLQVFDLKGSLRNRNVKTDSGKESCEVVLLDENLLKLIHDNPLYIRSHCKAILRAAIHSDSYFLSSHLIIDYSLLVGRDDTTDQLVVGIIGEEGGWEQGRHHSSSSSSISIICFV